MKEHKEQPLKKSKATILLDVSRHLIVLFLVCLMFYLLWNWSKLWAVILVFPVYVLVLNLVGFATLPLYKNTPENKLLREIAKCYENSEFDKASELNRIFSEKYKR